MQLGIHYAIFSGADQGEIVDRLVGTARAADEGGASWFTVMDHWFQMEHLGGPAEPMLEGYTTLGHLAAVTEKVRLGLLVTGVTYRHPGLLAKTVTTLDVLSRGRAMLGIGAAWYDREHAGLGVPYPSTKERFERLEEALQVAKAMWSDDESPFEGTHYRLAEPVSRPGNVSRPHPPILIGGMGERKTLRLVAQYGDACNLFGTDPEVIGHKLGVLREHCERLGRDPAEITTSVTIGADPAKSPEAVLEELAPVAALGIDTVCVMAPPEDPAGWAESFCAEVLPGLRQL
ncbi:LLM class F420-dependent oxidoreductase [Nocardioides sp. GY 10127]|uniref:LLM class F420-dependent oxidoreductase n=1 Tax=Nocardioides sp. GY 10127 TaxID=2569762 RepID=UPI0010A75CD1|nr:LLM class F420-dependent oxidoreductase [Nocardioides sp. GY 10127]TIC86447.1 LLM class F420-dependent oxidoreductase [Nocardioides sp. GY 10127]